MRILVLKLSDIGDVLTATPALRALRQTFPYAHTTVLVPPASAAALRGSPLADHVITFDKFRFDSPSGLLRPDALFDALALFLRLRRNRFDTVVVLHHLSTAWGARKFALLARITGAARIVGLDNGRGRFLTAGLWDGGFGLRHEVEYWLETVGLLGATTNDWTLAMPVSEADRAKADNLLQPAGRGPLIAIHPGSGNYSLARRWPVAQFSAVANVLIKAWDPTFVLVGGASEGHLTAELTNTIYGKSIDLGGKTTLGELAAVLGRCQLFIGNDSGVMHLASAVECPTVAIFGPSNPRAWGPWVKKGPGKDDTEEDRALVVRLDLPCGPCLYPGHGVGRKNGCQEMTCLTDVTPAMVLQAAERLLRVHVR